MKQLTKSYILITVGSLLFALSFNWLFVPNQVGMGGITGLAQVINALAPALPIGTLVFVINIPLFLVAWRKIGARLLASSFFSMAVSSVFIDLLARLHTFSPMDPMLSALFGGLLQGLGLGLVLSQGATTGGTDVIARLIKLKLPWLPLGRLLLIPDFVILSLAGLTFKQIESTLYGLLALAVTSKVIDFVLYGLENFKVAFIVTHCWLETKKELLALNRGVTILHGKGGFSNEEKEIIMIAFNHKEIIQIRSIVHKIDPRAFLIVCNAHEILGEGFGEYQGGDNI